MTPQSTGEARKSRRGRSPGRQARLGSVLVIRFSSLGDLVLTTPAIRSLRNHMGNGKIAVAVKDEYAPLAWSCLGVDSVLALPSRAAGFDHAGMLALVRKVRRERFDAVIDLHANPRSRLLAFLSGAPVRTRYDKRWLARRMAVRGLAAGRNGRQTVDLYLAALAGLSIEPVCTVPALELSEAAVAGAEAWLKERGCTGAHPLVGLAPGARHEAKRWGPERFSSVGRRLADRENGRAVIFGGKDEEQLLERVSAGVSPRLGVKACGLPLDLLPAVVAACDVFITNDTGPMHVAAALGVPVVAVFGPTHPMLGFAPASSRSTVLSRHLNCSPCSLHGEKKCRTGGHECLNDITAEEVIAAARQLLSEWNPPGKQ